MRRNISCTMRNSVSMGITKDIETIINASVTAVSLAKKSKVPRLRLVFNLS